MLLEAGFLGYVTKLRERGELQVFPELTVDSRGYHSRKITRWFSAFLASCGVDGDRKSFHSFRHTWRDAAREARLPEEVVKVMGGWARSDTASRYGSGYSLRFLCKELAKVEFTGLDISHVFE